MTTTSLLAGGMDMDEFAAYLQSQDAQILPPKSYEVLRYHHQKYGTAIVHHNKDGRIRFSDVAWEHYKRFRSNVPLANPIRTPRLLGHDKAQAVANLMHRDGPVCFYCGLFLGDDVTIEHILSSIDGGNNTSANCVLAHKRCNEAAGSLPVIYKVELRERILAEVAKGPPWSAEFDPYDIRAQMMDGKP